MQTYSKIKNFIALTNRANLKGESQVRMSTTEAIKLQTEISLLLIELKETEQGSRVITLDGGNFNGI